MNFISKLVKKPTPTSAAKPKGTARQQPREREQKRVAEEDYGDEDDRPPVPLFIGAGSGRGGEPEDDFEDGFLDDFEEEDSLELGVEAGNFGMRRQQLPPQNVPIPPLPPQHNMPTFPQNIPPPSMMEPHMGPPMGPPMGGGPNGFYPDPSFSSRNPSDGFIPPPINIPPFMGNQPGPNQGSPHGYMTPHFGDHAHGPPPPVPPAPTPGYYPTPRANFPPPMITPPAPIGQLNLLGLTEMEMIEYEQLVTNGVPESDAIRTVQYNRLLHPPHLSSTTSSAGQTPNGLYRTQTFSPLSRTPSGYLDSARSGNQSNGYLDEEEQIYQLVLQESLEEEKKNQQRRQVQQTEQERLLKANEKAMSLALQQSYDEHLQRSKSTSNVFTPSNGGSGRNASRATSFTAPAPVHQQPAPSQSSIERANEEALRKAIALSIQESSGSGRSFANGYPQQRTTNTPAAHRVQQSSNHSSFYNENNTTNNSSIYSTGRLDISHSADAYDYPDEVGLPPHQHHHLNHQHPHLTPLATPGGSGSGRSTNMPQPSSSHHHHNHGIPPPPPSSHSSSYNNSPHHTHHLQNAPAAPLPQSSGSGAAAQMILARRGLTPQPSHQLQQPAASVQQRSSSPQHHSAVAQGQLQQLQPLHAHHQQQHAMKHPTQLSSSSGPSPSLVMHDMLQSRSQSQDSYDHPHSGSNHSSNHGQNINRRPFQTHNSAAAILALGSGSMDSYDASPAISVHHPRQNQQPSTSLNGSGSQRGSGGGSTPVLIPAGFRPSLGESEHSGSNNSTPVMPSAMMRMAQRQQSASAAGRTFQQPKPIVPFNQPRSNAVYQERQQQQPQQKQIYHNEYEVRSSHQDQEEDVDEGYYDQEQQQHYQQFPKQQHHFQQQHIPQHHQPQFQQEYRNQYQHQHQYTQQPAPAPALFSESADTLSDLDDNGEAYVDNNPSGEFDEPYLDYGEYPVESGYR